MQLETKSLAILPSKGTTLFTTLRFAKEVSWGSLLNAFLVGLVYTY